MNLGGTEKALLSLIKTLGKESASITLLLLEKGGVLETQILDFVNVKYLEDFDKMKPIIENPPLQTLIALIASFKLFSAFTFLLTYCKIKISGNWYHNYKAALVTTPNFGSYDIAVAFAGPSDFISYFVINKVTAKKKIQWIHFDIEKVITNYNFGRKYYQFFDQIICVSEGAKKIFLKNFPQFENRTYVFYNIVIPAEIKKMAVEGDSFIDKYNGISGIVTDEIPYLAKNVQERVDSIRRILNEHDTLTLTDAHGRETKLDSARKRFRMLLERSVEEVLSNKTYERFSKNIHLKKGNLSSYIVTEKSDVDFLLNLFGRYSITEHDGGTSTIPQLRSKVEIEQDITDYSNWKNDFKTKQRTFQTTNAYS